MNKYKGIIDPTKNSLIFSITFSDSGAAGFMEIMQEVLII